MKKLTERIDEAKKAESTKKIKDFKSNASNFLKKYKTDRNELMKKLV